MLDTLIKTLQDVWSEEKLELVNRCNQVFLTYEYETVGVAVDYLLKQASSVPNEDLILRIMTVLEENLDILILNHTIQLTEARIQDKLFILETIAMIEDIDDQERINFLATDDVTATDDRDRLVDILEFVSGVGRHNFEHTIWSVHPSLIQRFAELSNSKINDYDYDVIPPPSIERVELFKKYINTYGRNAIMIAIAMGYRMNINYDFILDKFQTEITRLEPTDPKQAAIEIIGLLIMSSTPYEEIRKKANQTVSQLFNNAVFRTSTLSFISSVLSEVGING